MRDFDLGDILSITTGYLVSPRHMAGVYDILDYMTEDKLFTHQIPRVATLCKGPLLEQHPELARVLVPKWGPEIGEQVFAWLDEQKKIYGETLSVEPLEEYTHLNPIEELIEIVRTK